MVFTLEVACVLGVFVSLTGLGFNRLLEQFVIKCN